MLAERFAEEVLPAHGAPMRMIGRSRYLSAPLTSRLFAANWALATKQAIQKLDNSSTNGATISSRFKRHEPSGFGADDGADSRRERSFAERCCTELSPRKPPAQPHRGGRVPSVGTEAAQTADLNSYPECVR